MSQVGAPHWDTEVKERIDNVFYDLLVNINTRDQAKVFSQLLLTPTERTNLPRRLGVVIMLSSGVNQRTVSEEMHVSTSTVNKFSNKMAVVGLGSLGNYVRQIIDEGRNFAVKKIPRPLEAGGKFNPIELKGETKFPF